MSSLDHSIWTTELTERLWSFYAKERRHFYFSNVYAEALATLLTFIGATQNSKILDIGCGPGFLVRTLLNNNFDAYGIDTSTVSVQSAHEKLNIPLDRLVCGNLLQRTDLYDRFSFSTLIETIEHVDETTEQSLLRACARTLQRNGRLLVTVPHNENLENSATFCPFCSKLFHPVQHLRSIGQDHLNNILREAGFRVIFCRPMNLDVMNDPLRHPQIGIMRSPRFLQARLRLASFTDRFFQRSFPNQKSFDLRMTAGPHLVAVAEKVA